MNIGPIKVVHLQKCNGITLMGVRFLSRGTISKTVCTRLKEYLSYNEMNELKMQIQREVATIPRKMIESSMRHAQCQRSISGIMYNCISTTEHRLKNINLKTCNFQPCGHYINGII